MAIKNHLHNDWMNTYGTGNSIKKTLYIQIPSSFKGIKSFYDFLEKHKNKNGSFNNGYKSQKDRLEKLKATLNNMYNNPVDPIVYLYFLYFSEEINLRGISTRLENINNPCSNSTLSNMLSISFGWELRDKHEETSLKKKKDINKASINGKGGLANINKTKVDETKNKIKEILEKSSGNNFSIEDYNKNKFKIDKLSYIFFSFGIIKENSKKSFSEFLSKLKIDFGDHRIVNIILGIIEKLNINININIDMKEIYYWLNKNKN